MPYSKSEKKSIFKFLLLYYGSSFTLTFIIAFLSYQIFYSSILQTQEQKMKVYALNLSSQIINAHMNHSSFSFQKHPTYETFFLNEKQKIDLEQKLKKQNDSLYIIDSSSHHHLGIEYIIVRLPHSNLLFEKLSYTISLSTLGILAIIVFVGFFLTKMFIQPIKNERIRIDEFIKDTTHELNTPIHSLLLSLEVFEKNPLKNMARIKASAFRISDIYANLVYIFRLDEELKEIEKIDFKPLIEDEILIQEEYIKAKKLHLVCEVEAFSMIMDKESAKRIVANLLSNAIKYNKLNGKIHIYTTHQKLIFEDSGIGIKQEYLNSITTRYVRANNDVKGFGIGLDIVHKIAQKYHLKLSIIPKDEGVMVEIGIQ